MPQSSRPPHDIRPTWGEVGIHGIHRSREWDAVATVASELDGPALEVAVLADGRIVTDDPRDAALIDVLVRGRGRPPYRATAVRRAPGLWAVAVRAVVIAELPGLRGDEIEVAWDGRERSVRIDGEPTLASIPELERLGEARSRAYVVRASRLDADDWEVETAAL
jgi:hypothetical protein